MKPRSRTKAHAALVLLLITAACLAAFLVTCLPPETGKPSPATPALPPKGDVPAGSPHRPESPGRLALIIDDAGYSLRDLQPFLDFPGPLAVAVLPHLPHSTEAARRVKAAGKELLLHMPMEALNGENPGPGALRVDQSDAEVEKLLASAFLSVPGAEGLNNHMGSRATADERIMGDVARFLKREGKYFVDSRTTPDSVGARCAALAGVPFLKRNVFMDNERDTPDIEKSIALGVSEARSRGEAVLIGHVHSPQILAIVREQMRALPDAELRLAGLAEILGSMKDRQE